MAQQTINIGTAPNDGQGDPLRTAFGKCNSNFDDLFLRFRTTPPDNPDGVATDVKGMYAVDEDYFYYCFQDYVGDSTIIWKRIAGSAW